MELRLSAAQALDNDEYYATLDSGTNCHHCTFASKNAGRSCRVSSPQVPQSLARLFRFMSLMEQKRLVVALPRSAILVSQEWLNYNRGMDICFGTYAHQMCVPEHQH